MDGEFGLRERLVAEKREIEPEELFDELVWVPPTALPEPSAPWLPILFEQAAAGRWFHELRWD